MRIFPENFLSEGQNRKIEKQCWEFLRIRNCMISSFVVPVVHFLGSQTDNGKIIFPYTRTGTDGIAHVMSCWRLEFVEGKAKGNTQVVEITEYDSYVRKNPLSYDRLWILSIYLTLSDGSEPSKVF